MGFSRHAIQFRGFYEHASYPSLEAARFQNRRHFARRRFAIPEKDLFDVYVHVQPLAA